MFDLRQGLTFHFYFAGEGLNRSEEKAKDIGMIRGFPVTNKG